MWEGAELQCEAGNEEMNTYEQDWNCTSGQNRVSFNQSTGRTKHGMTAEDEECRAATAA